MAKRKRKMTLFDVINSGQPIGIQVRQRAPTYQPTPELPVKKKLAKLFGRGKKTAEDGGPLTAAQELELLRRELGGGSRSTPIQEAPSAPVEEPSRKAFASRDESVAPGSQESSQSESGSDGFDPTARFFASRSANRSPSDTLRTTREEPSARDTQTAPEETAEPVAPRKPRKSMRIVALEAWEKISPQVERLRVTTVQLGRGTGSLGSATLVKMRSGFESVRNLNTQHAATLATALSAVVVLGGAFYIGRVLLQRPTPETLVDASGINATPRPEVMDVDANSAVANVSRSVPEVALAKTPAQSPAQQPAAPASGVFGGRNTDLNYVIVQSYYTQAEADAAIDVLAKYGIRATVEKNLPGWRSGERDFFSIVSVEGYARLKDNAVYQAFLVTLAKISDREAGSTLPKRLDPRPYKYARSAQ